jgi:hypothetical protein
MNPEELSETAEEAHKKGEKAIGLTTAITAVLLAVATLLSHRAHTEEIKLQTKVNDGWGFYQAKHERAYLFALHAEDAVRAGANDLALRDLSVAAKEECGVPAQKNCVNPLVKDSPVLQKFIKENPLAGGNSHAGAAEGSTNVHSGGSQQEKQGKEAARKDGTVDIQVSTRKDGAVDVQEKTRDQESETDLIAIRADHYDAAELFLEISIVLCAIALLAEARVYWRLSFLTTGVGVGMAIWGWFLR